MLYQPEASVFLWCWSEMTIRLVLEVDELAESLGFLVMVAEIPVAKGARHSYPPEELAEPLDEDDSPGGITTAKS